MPSDKNRKKTTLQDIADALGITPSAVSKALNNHPRISDRTKKAVLEMAKKLNYQPNSLASALRSGRSYLLGVIVPAIDYAFFSSVVRGIEEVTKEAGYNIIISQSNDSYEKEKDNVDALLRTQVDGVLASIANSTTQFDHFKKLIENNVPLVLFDRVSDQLGVSTVVVDDFGGAFRATEHLLEQGCRKILHLAGFQRIDLYQQRILGYRAALKKYGIPVDEKLIHQSGLTIDEGAQIMQTLVERKIIPDGIFASGDHAALGAMHFLQERGYDIPGDIAIIGFSNEPFTGFIRPALSTLDQQNRQMGRLVAKTFLKELKPRKGPFKPQRSVLQPKLIIRESSLREVSEPLDQLAGPIKDKPTK